MTGEPEEIHARATDLEAKLDILSQSAKEMCSDCDIFWMEVEKGKTKATYKYELFLTKHKGSIVFTQNHFLNMRMQLPSEARNLLVGLDLD